MPHRLFSKIFTGIVALSFVAVSVVAPVGVRTVNAEFDIAELTSGMSVEEDLAGMALSCAAQAYVMGPLTAGVHAVSKTIGEYLNVADKIPAGVLSTDETSFYSAAYISAKSTLPGVAGVLGGAAGGASLAAGGISAAASVPTADWTQQAQQTAHLTGLSALMVHQGLMDSYLVSATGNKTGNEVAAKTTTGVFDCIVYTAGQLMLNQLTNNIVAWIQGGFDGSPAFTLNTHEIFLQLADMVAGDLAREIRGIAMCNFSVNFKNDLANRVELSAKYDYKFDDKTKCPFPETFNINSSDFYQEVNAFSWGAMEYALQDSGNPFGVQMLTNDELTRRTSENKEVRKQELSWSNGFTSMIDPNQCNYPEVLVSMIAGRDEAGNISDAEWDAAVAGAATFEITESDVKEYKKTYCKTTTPGKQIGDLLSKSTGIDMDRLGAIDNINKIIGALIEQITQEATEGIFCLAADAAGSDACENEVETDYVYIASKTAETVAMENAATAPCYDAWQDAIEEKSNAEENLAKWEDELNDAYSAIPYVQQDVDDLEKMIEGEQAIIDAAGDDTTGKIGNAKLNYDAVTSAEYSVARSTELDAANAEVDAAKTTQDYAETNYTSAYNTYYDYLGGSLSIDGTYYPPEENQLAAYKTAMDDASAVLEEAQAVYQEASDRLSTAQNPDYGC